MLCRYKAAESLLNKRIVLERLLAGRGGFVGFGVVLF